MRQSRMSRDVKLVHLGKRKPLTLVEIATVIHAGLVISGIAVNLAAIVCIWIFG